MAVWTRPCVEFPCLRQTAKYSGTSRNGLIKSTCSFIRTHVCTVALSLTLFNTVRLPREAYRYGAIPYLVVYSLWLLVVGLATSLLQLATGQLSQQDAVGVWRAVPILRGVGHIQLITSYLLCVYNILYVALAAAFLLWIGKDTFPLRVCTKLQMTPTGYENKVNASDCFQTTFLSPFGQHPEYIGIMAVLVFLSWFFLPIFLYGLAKSYKITMSVLAPITVILAIVLSCFLSNKRPLESMLVSAKDWTALTEPYIWFSGLVQATLSTQIGSGHLISSGGTIYKLADVRWVNAALVTYNLIAGWLWVLLWQSLGEEDGNGDLSFISVLSLIYQSSASLGRTKLWPLLAYLVVFLSGVITILSLLYPIYDRLQRIAGDKWKLIASVGSVLGTCMTLALLINAKELVRVLDELVVPVLLVFATTLEVVAFVFIYGCDMLRIDIEFLTSAKSCCFWMVFWWTTPAFFVGVTGWWLKCLLRETVWEAGTLWPLAGTFVGILVIMMVLAAVAVAKEEQFNLLSKIASAFRPSRLWGPEDPNSRYNWMVRRYTNEHLSSGDIHSVDSYNNHPKSINNNCVPKNVWITPDELYHPEEIYHRAYSIYTNTIPEFKENRNGTYVLPKNKRALKLIERTHKPPPNVLVAKAKSTNPEPKFSSPNVCVANDNLDCSTECYCNRHFTLNVPTLKRNELSTSL